MVMMNQADSLRKYGSQYNINKQLKEHKLYRIERGVYSNVKAVPELAILAFKYPNAVITMGNAFYLHKLTDVIPDVYDLATDRDAAKIKDKRVKQFFYPKETFREGVDKLDYRGYKITIYSKERMLIELVRYKSKLPYDYYKEILLNYRKIMPQLNIQEIQDMALSMPKSDKIMEILQAEVF